MMIERICSSLFKCGGQHECAREKEKRETKKKTKKNNNKKKHKSFLLSVWWEHVTVYYCTTLSRCAFGTNPKHPSLVPRKSRVNLYS